MNDTSSHIATLDQTDEDILTYTASDEALEAAAGTERGAYPAFTPHSVPPACTLHWPCSY
jgi:hypothetical protein